jgi:hypothetical protein
VQPPGPYPEGEGPQEAKSREEILGEPLTKEEINDAIERVNKENRQLNLGTSLHLLPFTFFADV